MWYSDQTKEPEDSDLLTVKWQSLWTGRSSGSSLLPKHGSVLSTGPSGWL